MVSSAVKTETARNTQRFFEALRNGVLQNLKELPDSNELEREVGEGEKLFPGEDFLFRT